MLDYLNDHPHLALSTSCEANLNYHSDDTKEAWNKLTVLVNIFGAERTPKQWMLTWIDLCETAKATFNRIANGEQRTEPSYLLTYTYNILMGIPNPPIEDAKKEFEKRPVVSSLLSLSRPHCHGNRLHLLKNISWLSMPSTKLPKKRFARQGLRKPILSLGSLRRRFWKSLSPSFLVWKIAWLMASRTWKIQLVLRCNEAWEMPCVNFFLKNNRKKRLQMPRKPKTLMRIICSTTRLQPNSSMVFSW